MTLDQFTRLKEQDQYTILWADGELAAQLTEEGFTKNLYALYDFWVEVWYDTDENQIDQMRTFHSLDDLGPYLALINLDL